MSMTVEIISENTQALEVETQAISVEVIAETSQVVEVEPQIIEVNLSEESVSTQIVEIETEHLSIDVLVDTIAILEIEQCPPGGGGSSQVKINFDYSQAPILNLLTVGAGQFLDVSKLVIETPFDDPAATLKIGTALDQEKVLGVTNINPQMDGTYMTEDAQRFTVSETLRLFIEPGASTQGSGFIILNVI